MNMTDTRHRNWLLELNARHLNAFGVSAKKKRNDRNSNWRKSSGISRMISRIEPVSARGQGRQLGLSFQGN